jgi:hypothetical protein
MLQRTAGGRFLELALFTLSSLVLYHVGNQVGIGVILFLIPLQVVASRRGEKSLLAACGLFLLVFFALRLLPFLGGELKPGILTIVETVFVVFMLLSLLVVNLPALARLRVLVRLLGMTLVAGCAAIPLTIWLSRNAQFQGAMGTLFTEASRMITSLFTGGQETADSAITSLFSPEAIRKMSEIVLSRSALALYFSLLSFSWWAGQASAFRSFWPVQRKFHFAAFRLESSWLWVLIATLALILGDLFFGARLPGGWMVTGVQYAAWNLGLVVVFLYGLQGLAIVRFLFEKNGLPRLLWLMLLVVLAVLAASPRVGLFVILALAAFGVSENWIRLRIAATKPHEAE